MVAVFTTADLLRKRSKTTSAVLFLSLQDDTLQRFDLPAPVLCSDGVLRVDLIGKVQRQEDYDNLYYTWSAR